MEIESLIKAIESLKPAENVFKDYIFPVFAPFLQPFLGHGLVIQHQSENRTVIIMYKN